MASEDIEAFIASLFGGKKDHRPLTAKAYRTDLLQFQQWLYGEGIALRAADVNDIQRYLDSLVAVGRRPSTVSRKATALRRFYKFLGAPTTKFTKNRTLHSPAPRTQFNSAFSEREMYKLLDATAGDAPVDYRNRAMLYLLYGLGLRITELTELNVTDVSLREKLMRPIGKYDTPRVLPLGGMVLETLRDWIRERERFAQDRGVRADKTALFLNRSGKRMSRQGVWRVIQSYAQDAGLDGKFAPHTIRDSCARHMLAGGAQQADVDALIGHVTVIGAPKNTRTSVARLREVLENTHPAWA